MAEATWVRAVADLLVGTPAQALPAEVQRAAARQTLDSVACALGAVEHEAARAMWRVVEALGGVPECSLIGASAAAPGGPFDECRAGGTAEQRSDGRSSVLNAILYNGTLIRALDANDILLRAGPGGHPSDNIAVALAFAERQQASGLEFLRAVALGYELYGRLRQHVYRRRSEGGYAWDHTSVSGLVGAAMAGLLLGLEAERLAHALAIGGAQTQTLSEVRGGEISMLKAAANAVAAHSGALGALLAAEGMTGPPRFFEGRQGLLAAVGAEPREGLLAALAGPIERWHIQDVSIKLFPAIGTSQSALVAVLELVGRHGLRSGDIEQVEVRFADLPVTREHLADPARRDPHNRETADHSIPFLVAAAIEDGELGPAQFADERWNRPSTRALMGRVSLLGDPALNAYAETEYPAVVTITATGGRRLGQEVLQVPGGPNRPLSDQALGEKLRRFAGARLPGERLAALEARLLHLDRERNMAEIGALLRGEDAEGTGWAGRPAEV